MEKIILDPIRNELLSADRVERMAHEMRSQFEEMVRQKNQRAEAVPAELKAISERIARLQDRRCKGDPDLEPDEIQAAIDLAEQKRRELEEAQPDAKESAKMIAMLPNPRKSTGAKSRLASTKMLVPRIRRARFFANCLVRLNCVRDRTRAYGRVMKFALPPY